MLVALSLSCFVLEGMVIPHDSPACPTIITGDKLYHGYLDDYNLPHGHGNVLFPFVSVYVMPYALDRSMGIHKR